MITQTTTITLIREDELQQHLEDDMTSVAPITPITRPRRFNRELHRHETFCCHHWWPGDTCFLSGYCRMRTSVFVKGGIGRVSLYAISLISSLTNEWRHRYSGE